MNNSPKVFAVLILVSTPAWAFPPSGLELGGSRRRRGVTCRENAEYLSNNICCTNCPAGKYMKSPCTTAGQMGECEECQLGTYTEHSNDLKWCLTCKQCDPDKELVRPCTTTQNAECQCKKGKFCAADQACEVCKTCSRCTKGEVIVRNCTATTDTECKKIKSPPTSGQASFVITGMIVLVAVVVSTLTLIWFLKKRKLTDSQRNQPDGLKAGEHNTEERRNGQNRLSFASLIPSRQPVRSKSSATTEDEYRELCESLCSSASNSQQSITIQQPSVSPASPPHASPVVPRKPNERDDEQFYKLVPVNGEESLRKCFEYFEELDVDYHKRFFRQLEINDNVIKSKEYLSYEDRIHELLYIWLENVGRDASLNDLLKVLLALNQRRTAEIVKQKAIDSGHYKYEN